MRRMGMIAAAVCGISLLTASAQAAERTPIRLLDNAQVAAGTSSSVDVMPVRVGVGWRGGGYYPGYNRPYYGGGYRGGYYGGYNGYNGGYSTGYRGGYYGNGYNGYRSGAYNSYYNSYRRPYYGGYYRY